MTLFCISKERSKQAKNNLTKELFKQAHFLNILKMYKEMNIAFKFHVNIY